MLVYKINVLAELKKRGYDTGYIRAKHIFGESVMSKFRKQDPSLNCQTINDLCVVLDCQPGDILEVVPQDDELDRLEVDNRKSFVAMQSMQNAPDDSNDLWE